MKNSKDTLIRFLAQSIPFIILSVSLCTIYGWVSDNDIFTKWLENGESMKMLTAICFILSSFMLIASSGLSHVKHKFCDVLISICSNWILLIVGGLASLALFDLPINFERTFMPYEAGISYKSGFPSLFNLIGFVLIALSGFIICFNTEKKYKRLELIGSCIYALGLTGLCGYILKMPMLYGHIDKISNGMAFHSALLFILYSAGLKLNCHKAMGEEHHKFYTKIFGF